MSRRRLEGSPRRHSSGLRSLAGLTLVVAVVGLVVGGLVLGGPVVGTAVAGDQLAVFSPVPHEVEADPGEEFEVDVVVRSWGGHGGVGVENVTLRALYHPEHLEVTDVDVGTWFDAAGADVETETTVANDRGVTEVRQYEDPPAGGTTGEDVFATLSVRVDEDAPPSNATIDFGETSAELAGEQPLPILERPVSVAIDGGSEPQESVDHGDLDDLEGDDPATEAAADDERAEAETDDPVAGFTALVAVVAFLVASVLAAVVGRRSGRRR